MAENSKIEWTDHTFNPWIGCQKISPGCANCYAQRDMTRKPRWANTWGPPQTSTRLKTSEANWRKPLAWNKKAEQEGRRYRIFCASLADVFEDNPLVVDWRIELWDLIEKTPNLDWLLLAKRPENIGRMLPDRWQYWDFHKPPRNIWWGISAENQDELEARWPIMESFARHYYPEVLFLSLEPLLGPVNLEICLEEIDIGDEEYSWWTRPVDWVIAGGESGPNARPMHPDWVRAIRDQCQEAEAPFHFKQYGEWCQGCGVGKESVHMAYDGQVIHNFAKEHRAGVSYINLSRVGKKTAGRMLDGREWNEFPANPIQSSMERV